MAVLDAVTLIPRGRVMTYGDVAEYVGTGRHVGAVLSRFGHEDVPWHRVVRSTGEPNPTQPGEALRRLGADATPLRPSGERVDLAAARWDGTGGRAPRAAADARRADGSGAHRGDDSQRAE
jgi:alkylated DNA nucleotide flippase Atl1